MRPRDSRRPPAAACYAAIMPNSQPRLLRACRRQTVDRTPVWFMRQAGRYMPSYRARRAQHDLLTLCRRPELAAEITIEAAETLGVDGAIIFSDLLLPAEPLGFRLSYSSGEGPAIEPVLRDRAAIAALPENRGGDLGYIAAAVAKVHAHFGPRLPVIGFAGAPFTLASYLIEGGPSRNFLATKRLLYSDFGAWALLMQKLCPLLVEMLSQQVAAGAAVIQLFDSWVGTLSENDYRHFVLPYNRLVIEAVQALGVPVIYFSTGTGGYLETLNEAGAAVLGLDWRVELDTAWRRLGYSCGLQGNLDPARMLAPAEDLRRAVKRLLDQTREHPGYIFNLGHGILPETDLEQARRVVEWVHEDNG